VQYTAKEKGMSKHPKTTRGGFTLIEILTVIGIIAILAAILVPVAGSARETALRRRAALEMNSIKVAVVEFHREHKYMPWPSNPGEPKVGPDMWTENETQQQGVMDLLSGNNPLGKAYLQVPEKSMPAGLGEGIVQFNDPWGNFYRIGMDRNMDGAVTVEVVNEPDNNPSDTLDGWNNKIVNESALVYTIGKLKADKPLKTFDVQAAP
jgi:prepilin-type N-terminal cleavage/methylation domain-containing protein